MKSIIVPATDDGPGIVTEFVRDELSPYDCSAKALYQLEVAIEEIMVNIASYAQLSEDDGAEIRCDILYNPLRVMLQFLDGGIPFDPLASDDPDLSPEALQERVGGLGIFLVKKMMDSVSYVYENGKNKLTIVKNLS